MNIESIRIRSYRSFRVDKHVPSEAAERYRTLKAYRQLRDSGCDEAGTLAHVGISRRTLYRWKRRDVKAFGKRPGQTQPMNHGRQEGDPTDASDVVTAEIGFGLAVLSVPNCAEMRQHSVTAVRAYLLPIEVTKCRVSYTETSDVPEVTS